MNQHNGFPYKTKEVGLIRSSSAKSNPREERKGSIRENKSLPPPPPPLPAYSTPPPSTPTPAYEIPRAYSIV